MCCQLPRAESAGCEPRRGRWITTIATLCVLASIEAFGLRDALRRLGRQRWRSLTRRAAARVFVLVSVPACVGTTGGEVVDFDAAAAGPQDAVPGESLSFTNELTNGDTWNVVLMKATLHVGAVYLSQSTPVSGVQNTSCILPGTYVAQVTSGLDVDLLSPEPQRFPTRGHGTTLEARVGQVWLTHGDVNQIPDPSPTPILDVEGTADREGDVRPFVGTITIAANRQDSSGQLAGADTICKKRIVSPIAASTQVEPTGGLLLRIDPRFLFVNVDFGQLAHFSSGYRFSDDPKATDPNDGDASMGTSPLFYSQPSSNLYTNLHRGGGRPGTALYSFLWEDHL